MGWLTLVFRIVPDIKAIIIDFTALFERILAIEVSILMELEWIVFFLLEKEENAPRGQWKYAPHY